jgi:hypothetical protein
MRPDSPSALKVSWLLVDAMRLWLFTHATLQQYKLTQASGHLSCPPLLCRLLVNARATLFLYDT